MPTLRQVSAGMPTCHSRRTHGTYRTQESKKRVGSKVCWRCQWLVVLWVVPSILCVKSSHAVLPHFLAVTISMFMCTHAILRSCVCGCTQHPTYQLCHTILGHPDASRLSEIIAAVGLAQNLAAIRAMATEGIQRGHMSLHARCIRYDVVKYSSFA